MELTDSYLQHFSTSNQSRYRLRETRNASAIFNATNPTLFSELSRALDAFQLERMDIVTPGGQESPLAKRFNKNLRDLGWREAQVDTEIKLNLRVMPYRDAGETNVSVTPYNVANKGYKVDNFKGRVALDLEWNAKDGNLDRDIGAYRSLYEAGLIDVGVIVTRTMDDLRVLARRICLEAGMDEQAASKKLNTTTTTNLDKLLPRMTRGDAGGCPILAIAISSDTFESAIAR